jgi:hypothetical protein
MASNTTLSGGRKSYASREKQFAAYDRLPRSVRAALANAAFDWAPFPIRHHFERGRYTAKRLVELVAIWDAQQIARDQKRVWGR